MATAIPLTTYALPEPFQSPEPCNPPVAYNPHGHLFSWEVQDPSNMTRWWWRATASCSPCIQPKHTKVHSNFQYVVEVVAPGRSHNTLWQGSSLWPYQANVELVSWLSKLYLPLDVGLLTCLLLQVNGSERTLIAEFCHCRVLLF